MSQQIEEGDYVLTPCGKLGSKTSVSQYSKCLGEFDSTEKGLEFIKQHMEENQFWPNIWWVSDHGNSWMIDTEGNEIKDEDYPYDPESLSCYDDLDYLD